MQAPGVGTFVFDTEEYIPVKVGTSPGTVRHKN
jgi:hypothetical protein